MRYRLSLLTAVLLAAPVLGQYPPEMPTLVLNTGGHNAPIFQAVFTPNSKELITVSLDKTIRFWDVATGSSTRVLRPPIGPKHEGELNAVALSPDGKTLAVAGFGFQDREKRPSPIYLIDCAADEINITQVLHGHLNTIWALAFSADGKRLASGGDDHAIRIWDVAAGKVVKTLERHTGTVTSLAFNPDGQKLVSAGGPPGNPATAENAAWLWSLQTGKVLARLQGVHAKAVRRVAWSRDGQRIATASQADPGDGFIALWDADGKHLRILPYRFGEKRRLMACESLMFTADGKSLVVSLRDGFYANAGVYPADGGEPVQFFSNNYLEHDVPSGAAVVSPDGKRVAVINDRHHRTVLYDRHTGKVERVLGGIGRQPAVLSWVRNDEPGKRLIAWRTRLPGQNYKPWQPLEAGFFDRAFRLDELAFTPLPAGKDERFVRSRLFIDPLLLTQVGGPQVWVERDKQRLATLKTPGEAWSTARAVTFLDADRVVVGTRFGLYLFDVSPQGKGKLLHSFSGNNGMVLSTAPSPDKGRYLLASADDQVIRVWAPDHPQPLLSLFVTPPRERPGKPAAGDWVAWTPEGYYAASLDGERLMGWHVNNGPNKLGTFHPATRFRARLYRPDAIKRLLAEGSLKKALQAADKVRGQVTEQVEGVAKVLPPRVRITGPAEPTLAITETKLTLKAEANSQGEPVLSLKLMLDDTPYGGNKGLVTIAKPGVGNAPGEWQVELTPGVHRLRVVARTASSLASSRELIVECQPPKPMPRKGPALYALCVGIDAYPGALRLKCAVNDATDLAKVLRTHSKPIFPTVDVQVLTNQQATKAGILAGLDWLNKVVTPQDVAVIFYAGHGVRDKKGEFFLLPVDGDPDELANTAVSRQEVTRRIQSLPGQRLVLLDACYSGGIGRLIEDLTRELIDEDCGAAIMCAATGKEESLEQKGHGYFTRSLIEGLSGKGSKNQRDGCVYLHHLEQYVCDKVPELSDDRQHPTSHRINVRPYSLSKP